MPTFFRKIRQKLAGDGKPLKYLRYAIGEIVLVVVGILIALQINNWNEEQKERLVEKQRYLNMLNDLRSDAENIDWMLTRLQQKQDLHYYLYEVSQKSASPDSSMDISDINRDPELILITGKNQISELGLIRDLDVRREVNAYLMHENDALADSDNLLRIIQNEVRTYFDEIDARIMEKYFVAQRYDNQDIKNTLDFDAISRHFNDTAFKNVLIKLRMNTSNALISLGRLKEENDQLQTTLRKKQ